MPVYAVYREEWSFTGKDMTWCMKCQNTMLLRFDSAKNGEKVLGTEKNPEGSSKIVSSEEVLRLANNSSFLRIDCKEES